MCPGGQIVTCDAYGNCPCPDQPAASTYVAPIYPTTQQAVCDTQLSASAQQIIQAAGHTITCAPESGWTQSPAGGCPPIMCSIDGGAAQYMAAAINQDPGVLLVQLGATTPLVTPSPAPTTTTTTTVPVPVTARLENLSRPGAADFLVGERWRVTVTGPPGQPVAIQSATQNGQSRGSTTYGATNASGGFTLEGAMTPDAQGTWTEVWSVGGRAAAPFSFKVITPVAAPATTTTAATAPTTTGATTTAPGDQTGYQPQAFSPRALLEKPLFDGVQVWMALAAGVGLLALVGGRR
jgi:hypothetical protein